MFSQQRGFARATGEGVWTGLLRPRLHRWSEIDRLEEGPEECLLHAGDQAIAVTRGTAEAERLLARTREVLAAQERGLLVPGDQERLAAEMPAGALSLAEDPEEDAGRGLSRVDA